MKYYQILFITHSHSDEIKAQSTNADVLNWIETQIKEVVPKCKKGWEKRLPSGERYLLEVSKLEGQGVAISWWLIKQLCEQGWKPSLPPSYDFHLVREVEEQSSM